jgi:hypothetical protein
MAPRLRRWLLLAFGGMAVLALWGLPPRSSEDWLEWFYVDRSRPVTPERMAYRDVNDAFDRLGTTFQRFAWADSVEALAESARAEGVSILAQLPDSAPPGSEGKLREGIREQLLALEVDEPLVTVGNLVVSSTAGLHPLDPHPTWTGRWELFVDRGDGTSHCVLVEPQSERAWSVRRAVDGLLWRGPDSSRTPNPLGPCAFHGEYGNPGDGIFAWLRSGGYPLAGGLAGYWARIDTLPNFFAVKRLGSRRIYGLSPKAESCVKGKLEICRDLFLTGRGYSSSNRLSPYPWDLSFLEPQHRPVAFQSRGYEVGFAGHGTRLLFDLEEEFGSERFARFWSSDQDVEEAFQAAFGLPAEEWLFRWAHARWGHLEVGPGIPLDALMLTFLTLGAFVGLGLYMGRRKA